MFTNRPKIRFLTFLISVITASAAVAFAAFAGKFYLLALVLFPCVIALSVSMIPTGLPPKVIMVIGAVSFLISCGVIIYVLFNYREAIWPYLGIGKK